MNYIDPPSNGSTAIPLSTSQKGALAAALPDAKNETRRYRRRPENLIPGIVAAKPVAEGLPGDSVNFVL